MNFGLVTAPEVKADDSERPMTFASEGGEWFDDGCLEGLLTVDEDEGGPDVAPGVIGVSDVPSTLEARPDMLFELEMTFSVSFLGVSGGNSSP